MFHGVTFASSPCHVLWQRKSLASGDEEDDGRDHHAWSKETSDRTGRCVGVKNRPEDDIYIYIMEYNSI